MCPFEIKIKIIKLIRTIEIFFASESSLSEARYSKTPGIVLASQNQSLASENYSPNRTPTNNNRDKVLSMPIVYLSIYVKHFLMQSIA